MFVAPKDIDGLVHVSDVSWDDTKTIVDIPGGRHGQFKILEIKKKK